MNFDFRWGLRGMIITIAGQGYTFNKAVAAGAMVQYVPPKYLIIGLLILTAILASIVLLIKKRKKK